MRTYQEFYAGIIKPSFAPPDWVFGVAWGIIYPLIIIAGIYLLYLTVKKRVPPYLIILFALNIVANLLFTPLQLGYTAFWPASLDILAVLITLAVLEVKVFKFSKLIFWLLVPYLLWGSFATVLQLTIATTNSPTPVIEVKSLLTEAQARTIAQQTCIKGGEALAAGQYNENTKTWWFDANLNATKPGCSPACVVDEEKSTAEINWRCTGLAQ